MSYTSEEIKKGIKIHYITNKKFKTNLIEIAIITPLSKINVTKNALIPMVLKRGTKNIKTQDKIYEKLEEMYGAIFNYDIEKVGNFHILKFNMQILNDNFILKSSNLLNEAIDLILEIIFNPLLEENTFKKEYVLLEKENLKDIINSKINNKDKYAFNRCIEEMHKNKPYGIYKYGYIEDLESINENNLYEYYINLIKNSKIDIYVSGDISKKEIKNITNTNENILKLNQRNFSQILSNLKEINKEIEKVKIIKEKNDVNQGKLVIGLDITKNIENLEFISQVYNTILGSSPNSKLFKIVREKEKLAYTINSKYIKNINNIYIYCGIDIKEYNKTIEIIKEQLVQMEEGKFSNKELENAKKHIISIVKGIEDEQELELMQYIMQEIVNKKIKFDEYINKINNVTKNQIINIAQNIKINTIYFLTNK